MTALNKQAQNNHPAHGPVSLERLHQISEILSKAAAQSDGGNLGYAMADAVKVINEVLAARKAGQEPVAWVRYCSDGTVDGPLLNYQIDDCRKSTWTPLYAAPQLPQPVPEHLAAVATLESKGYTWHGGQLWKPPIGKAPAYITVEQPAVVDADDNFYSWFGREWHEHYQHNQYTTAAKQMLGVMAESAWKAARSSAMLQDGNFREIQNSSTNNCREISETSTNSPALSPIDHGYRPDCECSGCIAIARICAELAVSSQAIPDCWCRTCRPVTMNDMRFVVCPDCGNKRCPRANDHRNSCTGSNAPGQDGSAYPEAPKEVKQ